MVMKGLQSRMDFDDVIWERSENDYESWSKAYLWHEPTARKVGQLIVKHRLGSPVEMGKIMQGGFNIVYRMKFLDGGTAIARFPMPGIVKFPEEKVRTEVATMRYIQEHTTIPVPFVLHCGTSEESPDGLGPFIIMEWVEHETDLFEVLVTPERPAEERPILHPDIPLQRLEYIYSQLANILLQLSKLKLPKIGALIQQDDGATWSVGQRPFSQQMNQLVDRGGFPAARLLQTTFNSSTAYFQALSQQMMLQFVTQTHNCISTVREGRSRYMARYLFSKLAAERRLSADATDCGPFPLFFDDMRASNILLSKSDRIVGVIDWEFTYSAPTGFTTSPPWWLLIDQPEYWPDDWGNWADAYRQQLDILLRCLEEKENEALCHNRMKESERLSTAMRRSWDTGDFWLHYMVRRPWAFDAIYWREIDKRYFGVVAGDVLEERIKLLSADESDEMERLVNDKMQHHERMLRDRSTCCLQSC